MTIRNPVEWGYDQARGAVGGMSSAAHSIQHGHESLTDPAPAVRRIHLDDLWTALRRGFDDFAACRTDVLALGLIYPLAGILLIRLSSGVEVLPLMFPLLSGFALIGPFAASGLYEMSRRREQGEQASWLDAFNMFSAPRFGSYLLLALVLTALFFVWLAAAWGIYEVTLGPEAPASLGAFVRDVFYTPQGWMMTIIGCAVGFLFALIALTISVVSFPLMLDRKVGALTAMATSARAVAVNPVPMLAWGAIVAGGLALGSLPALLGLIVVVPVLGHATWHLYRRMVD